MFEDDENMVSLKTLAQDLEQFYYGWLIHNINIHMYTNGVSLTYVLKACDSVLLKCCFDKVEFGVLL